jgi:hypothetical protein
VSDEDPRALLLRLVRLVEPLAVLPAQIEELKADVATLKGYAAKHEGAIEGFDGRLAKMHDALEHQGDGLFAISKDLQDLRTSVLGAAPAKVPIEHERIDRLSERAR